MHDDTYIIADPPMLPVHTTAMPQPPTPTTVDSNMPRHAMVE